MRGPPPGREKPWTNDGSDYYNPVYDDLFADNSPRDLFNVFSVNRPVPLGQGSYLRADGARRAI